MSRLFFNTSSEEYAHYRNGYCFEGELCFISLKPLRQDKSDATLVWNHALNDSVWVKKEYAPAGHMEEVRKQMAKKQFAALEGFDVGIPRAELKSFLERTLHTTISE